MNSKLVILAGGKPMTLTDDFSIDVELQNPLFNDTEMFSYPVSLPLDGNRHFLKNPDDINSDIRPVDYEHTPMRIIADGVPFASGTAVMQEDEEVSDALSVNIDASTQTFDDLISDLNCNEVPIPARYKDQLLIGEKIDAVNVQLEYKTDVVIKYQGKKGDKKYGSVGKADPISATFYPQALGFSYPGKCEEEGDLHKAVFDSQRTYSDGNKLTIPKVEQSYINVKDAYPLKLFCNARVCYKHYDIENGETSSNTVEQLPNVDEDVMYENHGPIWVLEADRPQSGICFYVLFFLDCLFESLGVSFDKDALMEIGDFRRLCFFTTKCAYDTEPLYFDTLYKEEDKEVIAGLKKEGEIKRGFFQKSAKNEAECYSLFDEVNAWLESRGCGGQLALENPRDKSVQQITYHKVTYEYVQEVDDRFHSPQYYKTRVVKVEDPNETTEEVGKGKVASITTKSTIIGAQMSAGVVRMFANEKNFPAESVSTVIESLENQFGIKFDYDYERKKVTAYLVRDVFRKQKPKPRQFNANILSIAQLSEKITGVRVGYSEESDTKEQRNNVNNGVKDYNTDYDYIDYPKGSTVTSLEYKDILPLIKGMPSNVFVDKNTGNKYRVKIDSDYKEIKDMKPRLFEVGAYKGVEVGDCSTINDDFVQEFLSDFVPVGLVDVNYRKALSASYQTVCFTESPIQPETGSKIEGYATKAVNGKYAKTVLAANVDEDMEHEFIKQYIRNPISSAVADFYVTEILQLRESYNPSDTDDGNSPLQTHDWGLSIAVMRGGGTDSDTENFDYNYDGFGNSKWRTTVGEYALTADSVDPYGIMYDYNGGNEEGIGNEERFSLKPRAWVQPDWADAPLVVNDPLIKNRGYFDTFMVDYAYFLLNRKKYRIKCLASVAQIADIPNHWKEWWLIAGKKCLINKVSTDISVTDGMGEVELEVYSL